MSNLPEKMKAVVAYGPNDYRLEMVPTPRAGKEEVVIKVEACGICGSDIKAFMDLICTGGERIHG